MTTTDQVYPKVEVSGNYVHVLYRNDAATSVVYRRSTDGGDTFESPVTLHSGGNAIHPLGYMADADKYGFLSAAGAQYELPETTTPEDYSLLVAAGPYTLAPAIGLPLAATRLLPKAPNPFNPSTTIRFDLAEPGRVRVAVYDAAGRLVRNLLSGQFLSSPGLFQPRRVFSGPADSSLEPATAGRDMGSRG